MRLKHYRGTLSVRPGVSSNSNAGNPNFPTNPSGFRVASGVNGAVVDKGPLARYFPFLCQSIRHGFQDIGTKSIEQLKEDLNSGKLRFELRSTSAQKEGGIHDLHSFTQRLYA